MFYRRHIAEYSGIRGLKIHPSLYVKHSNNSSLTLEEKFAYDFFRTSSNEKLNYLWRIAEKYNEKEIPIYFYKERENGTITHLSKEEMAIFDFEHSSWHLRFLLPREDVVSNVSEHPIAIIFHKTFQSRTL